MLQQSSFPSDTQLYHMVERNGVRLAYLLFYQLLKDWRFAGPRAQGTNEDRCAVRSLLVCPVNGRHPATGKKLLVYFPMGYMGKGMLVGSVTTLKSGEPGRRQVKVYFSWSPPRVCASCAASDRGYVKSLAYDVDKHLVDGMVSQSAEMISGVPSARVKWRVTVYPGGIVFEKRDMYSKSIDSPNQPTVPPGLNCKGMVGLACSESAWGRRLDPGPAGVFTSCPGPISCHNLGIRDTGPSRETLLLDIFAHRTAMLSLPEPHHPNMMGPRYWFAKRHPSLSFLGDVVNCLRISNCPSAQTFLL